MSRRRAIFQKAADVLLRAGCDAELLALRALQAADLETVDGTDTALASYRTLSERIRARRIEADDARTVAEQSSASFELRGYLRVRVSMLDDCERAINAVGRNLLSREVAA